MRGGDAWATVGAKRGAGGSKPPPIMSRQTTAPAAQPQKNSFAAFEKTKRDKDPKEERKKKPRDEEEEPVKEKRRSKEDKGSLSPEELKAEIGKVTCGLGELSSKDDVDEAALCLTQLGKDPSMVVDLLERVVVGKAGERKALIELIVSLADKSRLGQKAVAKGLDQFFAEDEDTCCSRYDDMKEDLPLLPKILREQLFPGLCQLSQDEFKRFEQKL